MSNNERFRSSSITGSHLEEETFARLERGELDAAEINVVLAHVRACPRCAKRIAAERGAERAAALLDSLDEPECHLDLDEEMIPYVDGALDAAGVEIVESHLDDCVMCRAEVDDLRAGRPDFSPAGRAEARPTRWGWLAVAAAVIIALIAVLIAIARRPREDARPVIVRTTTSAVPPEVAVHGYERPEWTALVDRTLNDGRLPVSPEQLALQREAAVLRGNGTAAEGAVSPAGVFVEATRPTFIWPSTLGGSYTVFVYAGDAEIANSGPVRHAQWTPARPLARGRTYSWQVETRSGGTKTLLPQPVAARFRILGTAEHDELEAARAAHPDDPLLLATLAARAGLVKEARAELDKLASSSDPRVRRLVAQEASPIKTNGAQ